MTTTIDLDALHLDKGSHPDRSNVKPLVPKLVGTRADGRDETRGLLALDWLVRVYTPTWLTLAHFDDEAAKLRDLARIVDLDTATAAGPVVRDAQRKGDAARAAARAAAGAAAGAAAWAALAPTVIDLQHSATDLFARMITGATS